MKETLQSVISHIHWDGKNYQLTVQAVSDGGQWVFSSLQRKAYIQGDLELSVALRNGIIWQRIKNFLLGRRVYIAKVVP